MRTDKSTPEEDDQTRSQPKRRSASRRFPMDDREGKHFVGGGGKTLSTTGLRRRGGKIQDSGRRGERKGVESGE